MDKNLNCSFSVFYLLSFSLLSFSLQNFLTKLSHCSGVSFLKEQSSFSNHLNFLSQIVFLILILHRCQCSHIAHQSLYKTITTNSSRSQGLQCEKDKLSAGQSTVCITCIKIRFQEKFPRVRKSQHILASFCSQNLTCGENRLRIFYSEQFLENTKGKASRSNL